MSDLPRHAVGIDPSLSGTGVAAPWSVHVVTTWPDDELRMVKLYDGLIRALTPLPLLDKDHPDADCIAIVEDLPTHAKGAGLTGMAQGVIRLALQRSGIPYQLVTAATLKKFATGSGNATKPDMRMAWYKRTGEDVRNDNAVDALWLREIGRHAIGHSEALDLPKAQRECILKLAWPEPIAAHLLKPYERMVSG